MNHLVIDLINLEHLSEHNNGYKHCLTGMDGWSKYPFAEALFDKTSEGVAAAVNHIIANEGIPGKIHCDNGTEFMGALKELCEKRQIPIVHGAPYRPNVQGADERWNQTLKKELGKWMHETGRSDWINHLPEVLEQYRMQKHSVTGIAPFLALKKRNNDRWYQLHNPKASKSIY